MVSIRLVTLSSAMLLAGCGTVAEVGRQIEEEQVARREVVTSPFQPASRSRVAEVRGSFIPVTPMSSLAGGQWLRQKKVSLDIKNPTPMSSIITKFAEQGLNISTDLPLSSYTYVGRVNQTDAETALKAVLGSVGLDYQVDDERQLIIIRPVASRSWTLNIGNRRSVFSSDTESRDGNNSGSGRGNSGSGGGSGSFNNQGGLQASGGLSGMGTESGGSGRRNQNNSSGNDDVGAGVYTSDDFWPSLARELEARLTIQVPQPGMMGTGMPGPMPASGPGGPLVPAIQNASVSMLGGPGTELYAGKKLGSYSLNPETGSITVQAPQWVLSELDNYIQGVQEMYNTNISFTGEVVLVTTSRGDSEGFDLSGFASWASGKYGAIITNNALGGVTVSMPDGGVPSVTTGSQSVAGPMLGMQYRGSNALDIFNAYLQQIGKVSVIQKPMLTTTSGVPGVFRKKRVDYYNTVSQMAAPGGTGSAVAATQNVIVPVETGTDLRINPRVDVSTGLIRAQIKLEQVIQSGTRTIPQTITFGNTAQAVNTTIPILTEQDVQGEVLLKDGDLVIVGGQTEDSMSADESGLPGGARGPLGGIFGTKEANRGKQTYYFALRVTVNKRQ